MTGIESQKPCYEHNESSGSSTVNNFEGLGSNNPHTVAGILNEAANSGAEVAITISPMDSSGSLTVEFDPNKKSLTPDTATPNKPPSDLNDLCAWAASRVCEGCINAPANGGSCKDREELRARANKFRDNMAALLDHPEMTSFVGEVMGILE